MNNTKTPCIDCERRHMGCHSRCEDYKKWKDEHEARRKEYHEKRNEYSAFQDYISKSYGKMHSRGSARYQQRKEKGIRRDVE